MVKNHLSRLVAPKSWPIQRKGIKFITRPTPGAHTLRSCIPLSLVLTGLLRSARTNKEVKKLLQEGKIFVNNVAIKSDKGFAVGIMDMISIPSLNENYRVILNSRGKFILLSIDDKESELKLSKVENKTVLKGGRVQLNNTDGSNLLVKKDDYSCGDTIVLSLKDKSVKEHLKFEKGATVYLTGGKNIGRVGVLEDVNDERVVVKSEDKVFETAQRYAFVVGNHTVKSKQ